MNKLNETKRCLYYCPSCKKEVQEFDIFPDGSYECICGLKLSKEVSETLFTAVSKAYGEWVEQWEK